MSARSSTSRSFPGPDSGTTTGTPQVHIAWQAAQELRSAFHQRALAKGRRTAEHVLASFPSCPIPQIARLGRTLRRWREPFLAYFATTRASYGGTEAVNDFIELHRSIARCFRSRDKYRLRMLLIAGGLTDHRLAGPPATGPKSP